MERRLLILAVLALMISGCGGGSGNRPKTYAASGKVTLNGAPVEGAVVNFYPLEAVAGAGSAIGTTDKDGKYTLTTFTSNDGALPGQYKVSIVKYEGGAPPPSASSSAAGTLASGELDAATYKQPAETGIGVATPEPTGPKNLIPAKYSSADTSGLRGTISDSGSNENNFDLK